jgi:hypothetical protein
MADTLDAQEAAVYLSTVLGRRISPAYVRVLAHRYHWTRNRHRGRTRYRLLDIDATVVVLLD